MRRTAIKPKQIYQLARKYIASRPGQESQGGRPRTFDNSLILTIASIQNLHQFSFREALEYCEDFFKDLPTLATYHYRLSKLPPDIPRGFIEYLASEIKSFPNAQKVRFFIADGTGFSYHDLYPLKIHRGLDIRKIKAHVKAAALVGVFGKRRFILSAATGPAFSGETKLIKPLLEALPAVPKTSRRYFLADKGFDSLKIMKTAKDLGLIPVIPIKQHKLHRFIDPLREASQARSENKSIYKKRALVESLFGNVKQKLSSHVRIFKLNIAETFVLLRLALFNMAILASLQKAEMWVWFSNSLSSNDLLPGFRFAAPGVSLSGMEPKASGGASLRTTLLSGAFLFCLARLCIF